MKVWAFLIDATADCIDDNNKKHKKTSSLHCKKKKVLSPVAVTSDNNHDTVLVQ